MHGLLIPPMLGGRGWIPSLLLNLFDDVFRGFDETTFKQCIIVGPMQQETARSSKLRISTPNQLPMININVKIQNAEQNILRTNVKNKINALDAIMLEENCSKTVNTHPLYKRKFIDSPRKDSKFSLSVIYDPIRIRQNSLTYITEVSKKTVKTKSHNNGQNSLKKKKKNTIKTVRSKAQPNMSLD